MKQSRPSYTKAVLLFMAASLCLAFINILAGGLCLNVAPICIIFIQMLTAFVLLLPYSLRGQLKTTKLRMHLLRGAITVLGTFIYYTSLKFLPLLNVVFLENATPLIIPFISMIWLRERIPLRLWIAIGVGFIGVYYIVRPETSFFNFYSFLPLLAALCVSIVSVSIAKLNETESDKQITFYFFGIASLLTFPFFIKEWNHIPLDSLLPMFCIGALLAASQLFVIFAYKYSLPAKLAPFVYTENLFTLLLRWSLYGDLLSHNSAIGLSLILISASLMFLTKQQAIE